MKCPECGAVIENPPGGPDARCSYCGAVLPAVPPAPAAADPVVAALREVFEDRDGDGVPDVFEGLAGKAASVARGSVKFSTTTRTRFVVNGTEYSSVDEMPPEVRAVFGKLAGGGGLTDALRRAGTQHEVSAPYPPVLPSLPSAEPRPAGRARLVATVAVAVALLAVIALVVLLLAR